MVSYHKTKQLAPLSNQYSTWFNNKKLYLNLFMSFLKHQNATQICIKSAVPSVMRQENGFIWLLEIYSIMFYYLPFIVFIL